VKLSALILQKTYAIAGSSECGWDFFKTGELSIYIDGWTFSSNWEVLDCSYFANRFL